MDSSRNDRAPDWCGALVDNGAARARYGEQHSRLTASAPTPWRQFWRQARAMLKLRPS